MKTIAVPENIHKELVKLRLDTENKNTAELIKKMILSYKQTRFLEASKLFNKKLKQKNTSFEKLLKKSKNIREEISNEWFD